MRGLSVALLVTVSAVCFSQMASAADLPVKAPIYKAPVAPPPYNWTGQYVGFNLGGSWGSQDNSLVTTTGVSVLSNSDHLDGVIGGGQIGYNWQINQWVLGIEADFQGSGQKGDGSFSLAGGGASSFIYVNRLYAQARLVRHGTWSDWLRV